MRSTTEIRERSQATLEAMLKLPGMYSFGRCYEGEVRRQLQDLAFIDCRDAELAHELELLHRHGLWGSFGTWGVLANACGSGVDFIQQVAAIYARVAARLGYFIPARRMTSEEWERARDVAEWASVQTRSLTEVKRRYGVPSYQYAGQWSPRALGYAGPYDDAWLYFFFDGDHGDPRLAHLLLPLYPRTRGWITLRCEGDSTRANTAEEGNS